MVPKNHSTVYLLINKGENIYIPLKSHLAVTAVKISVQTKHQNRGTTRH